MKRYLLRAGYDPYKYYRLEDELFLGIYGCNTGNMLYCNGVVSALGDKDVKFKSTFYKTVWTEEEIDRINSEYDAFILPWADAFRREWKLNLINYKNLILKLRIPCIVIGVGLRADLEDDGFHPFEFDSEVRDFVKAVLSKSAKIGLRGRNTGNYLRHLGFKEHNDFEVIGCPSLYTKGKDYRMKDVNKMNRLAFNFNYNEPDIVSRFILKSSDSFKDSHLISQDYSELLNIYINKPAHENRIFTQEIMDRFNRQNKHRAFVNFVDWEDYLKEFDLVIGGRFHGTAAAVLAGLPHVLITLDSRMQEFAEFHNITHISVNDLKRHNWSTIFDVLDRLDFDSFHSNYDVNLTNYISFLESNHLEAKYNFNSCFQKNRKPPMKPYCVLKPLDKMKRIEKYYSNRIKNQKKDLEKYERCI